MELDKNHLDQFENIAPPMRAALTLPINGKGFEGVTVYVCCSPFARCESGLVKARRDVLAVAQRLMLAPDITKEHAKAIDAAEAILALPALAAAITEAKAALVGASNDAEHDALYLLVEALGLEVPMCNCDQPEHEGQHSENCPCKAWEKPNECQHMTVGRRPL